MSAPENGAGPTSTSSRMEIDMERGEKGADGQAEPTTTAQGDLAMEAPGDQEACSSANGVGEKAQGKEKEGPAKESARQYEVWPGNEKFFCGGRFVTGPYYWGILGTAFLILVPCGVFLGLVAFPLYTELDYGIVLLVFSFALTALATVSLFCSGCMDPGILPRSPPPPSTEHLPRTRNVEVNGHMVVVRYNETCNFYQPPRAHHCSVLNDCIERFDHYCPWVGTTVGKRNYRFYLLFVFSSSILCIFTFTCSAFLIKLRADEEDTNTVQAIKQNPAALFMMVYVFIGFWFVGGLSGFHIYLISKNQTTYENIRYSYDNSYVNPYNLGCLQNWAQVWCGPIGKRNCDFSARVDPGQTVEMTQL